jgi:predicted CopG family antitoxin
MSTKNIALDSTVYRRLAAFKGESESFSKAVARMMDEVEDAHTGRDIRSRLSGMPALCRDDAEAMMQVLGESRREEIWEAHDLG